MTTEHIIRSALDGIRETGEFIAGELKGFDAGRVDEKSVNQLVSYVDITAEKKLVALCEQLTPGCGFITEENTTDRPKAELTWIIDPLDGTTNFIHGLPVFSVSVGLQRGDALIGGIIYEINRNEMFCAWENGPAWMNEEEIRVSKTAALKDSLLATGFPYYDYQMMEEYLLLLKELMKGSRGLRRMGSAAVDLAYVACGRFDAFFEYSLNPWDVAAGAFIVQQAGGKMSDFSGGNDFLFGKEIVACNNNMYPEFLKAVSKAFKS